MSYERELASIDECHVFKIGPRPSHEGYTAENWYKNEIWCGKLGVYEKNDKCEIRLENQKTGKVFARCKNVGPSSVERTIDSSRYFVLKIEKKKKKAFIGIGFSERSEAFDFKDALDRFEKYKTKEKVAEQLETIPTKDYQMKSGEKIKVNFSVKTKEVEHTVTSKKKKKKKGKKKFSLSLEKPSGTSGGRRRRKKKGSDNNDDDDDDDDGGANSGVTNTNQFGGFNDDFFGGQEKKVEEKKVEEKKETNLLDFM